MKLIKNIFEFNKNSVVQKYLDGKNYLNCLLILSFTIYPFISHLKYQILLSLLHLLLSSEARLFFSIWNCTSKLSTQVRNHNNLQGTLEFLFHIILWYKSRQTFLLSHNWIDNGGTVAPTFSNSSRWKRRTWMAWIICEEEELVIITGLIDKSNTNLTDAAQWMLSQC